MWIYLYINLGYSHTRVDAYTHVHAYRHMHTQIEKLLYYQMLADANRTYRKIQR